MNVLITIQAFLQRIILNELFVQICIVSLGFVLLRKVTRMYIKRWLGKKYEAEETISHTQLLTKLFWVMYGLTIWFLLKNSHMYNQLIQLLGEYDFFNSEYLAVNLYSLISICVIGYVLYTFLGLGRGLLKISQGNKSDYYETIDSLINHIGFVLIFVILLFVGGVSWKVVVPIVSALGIGVGFGLQDIVHNITSGIILLSSQEVKPGDWISIGEKMGKVVTIGLRSSVINTLDNVDVIIPNSQVTGNQITNWSYKTPSVRIAVHVGVAYKSDVAIVTQTLLDAAKEVNEILKVPEPDVLFEGFGDSSLNFTLRVWINIKKHHLLSIQSKLHYATRTALQTQGIEIPFPQQDIRFKNALPTSPTSSIT